MIKVYLLIPFFALILSVNACNSQSAAAKVKGETTASEQVASFYKNVDVKMFSDLIKKNAGELIDVRTPQEFQSGHIQGAKNINVLDPSFADKIAKLDKSKTYMLYCRSGHRSGKALEQMRAAGFSKIYNLSGGVMAWTSAGEKLSK